MTSSPDSTRSAGRPRPQLRLPGQAAAPEGPVDMSMMYLMHHAFRRDLAAFAEAVPVTPVTDRGAWRALAGRWEIFAGALHHHHEGEDTWIWPALRERADSAELATLDAMEAEHGEIDPLLESCAAGFVRMREHADADQRAALTVRLVAAREALAKHLRHEETEAIPLLQRVMSQAEWEAIDDRLKAGLSPLQLIGLVPWVLHRVPVEAQQRIIADAGLVQRLVWLLTRGVFSRREARIFGRRG